MKGIDIRLLGMLRYANVDSDGGTELNLGKVHV